MAKKNENDLEVDVKHIDTLDRVIRQIEINEIAVEYNDTIEITIRKGQSMQKRWKRYGQTIRFNPKEAVLTTYNYREVVDTIRREIRTRVEHQQLEDIEREVQKDLRGGI